MVPCPSGDEQNEFFYWNRAASSSMQLASPPPKIAHQSIYGTKFPIRKIKMEANKSTAHHYNPVFALDADNSPGR